MGKPPHPGAGIARTAAVAAASKLASVGRSPHTPDRGSSRHGRGEAPSARGALGHAVVLEAQQGLAGV